MPVGIQCDAQEMYSGAPDLKRFPELAMNDKDLLNHLFSLLADALGEDCDPYGDDSLYGQEVRKLPAGLRAMAATYHLDVSLTLDDIGWHFGNFGAPDFVQETEAGLVELGLKDLAKWFAEAHSIVSSLRPALTEDANYYEVIREAGVEERLGILNRMAIAGDTTAGSDVGGSAIFAAWVRYARAHPETLFPANRESVGGAGGNRTPE